MERLTRPCEDTENGKYIPYTVGTYIGIYPDCTLGRVVERLAYYENLEEKGEILILNSVDTHPCTYCDHGWGTVSSSGCTDCTETCEKFKNYINRSKV